VVRAIAPFFLNAIPTQERRAMNKELINRPMPTSAKRPPSPVLDLCDCTPDDALKRLDAARTGLTPEQVEQRLEKYGPNEITHEKPPTWFVQLFHAFLTPFGSAGVLYLY
jgi:Mg2+-importing ATPase